MRRRAKVKRKRLETLKPLESWNVQLFGIYVRDSPLPAKPRSYARERLAVCLGVRTPFSPVSVRADFVGTPTTKSGLCMKLIYCDYITESALCANSQRGPTTR